MKITELLTKLMSSYLKHFFLNFKNIFISPLWNSCVCHCRHLYQILIKIPFDYMAFRSLDHIMIFDQMTHLLIWHRIDIKVAIGYGIQIFDFELSFLVFQLEKFWIFNLILSSILFGKITRILFTFFYNYL